MILGPVKLTVNVNGHPGLILDHCKEQASEQAACVGRLSQGRQRESNKKGGKPWLKPTAAGNKSQGGEAVECTPSLPQEVQKRGRVFIFRPPPPAVRVLIQDTPSLTSSAFVLEVFFNPLGF